jgi:hypothetical protein
MRAVTSIIIVLFLVFLSFSACKHKVKILPNNEIYTCKVHVHVSDDHPAKCPLDDSDITKTKITEEPAPDAKRWRLSKS